MLREGKRKTNQGKKKERNEETDQKRMRKKRRKTIKGRN